MGLLKAMFGTLGGWLMFVLGVLMSGMVMSWVGQVKGKVSGG